MTSSPIQCSTLWIIIQLMLALYVIKGNAIKMKAHINGKPCHGDNVLNNEQLSNFADIRATFNNAVTDDMWATFTMRQLGCEYEGVQGPCEGSSAIDSTIVSWLSPETHQFMIDAVGVDLTDPAVEDQDRFGRSFIHPYALDTFEYEFHYAPFCSEADKMDATCFTDRDDVTLGEWNAVSGQLTLECEVDGTGYYDIKVHNLLPWTLYTVWALFACSESHGDDPRCPGVDADGNPVGSPMYYNMMGGYSSVIMTDRKGYGAIDKPLSYCPLDTVNPLMVVNLLAHPDGVIWGGMPAGLKNLAPFVADHITFQVGDELLE